MVRRSPTLETTALVLVVFAITKLGALVPFRLPPVALAAPLDRAPWTLITSVYAHLTVSHLVANLIGLLVLGVLIERRTTPARFHTFVLGTGVITGLSEVLVGGLTGTRVFVLGISGAVYALLGYLLAGNLVTRSVLNRFSLSPRIQIAAGIVVALGITAATAGPGMALAGHAAGLLLGLVAGRIQLLDVEHV